MKTSFPTFYILFFVLLLLLPVDECMSMNELKIGKKISIFNFLYELKKKIILFAFTIKYFQVLSSTTPNNFSSLISILYVCVCVDGNFNIKKVERFLSGFVNFARIKVDGF